MRDAEDDISTASPLLIWLDLINVCSVLNRFCCSAHRFRSKSMANIVFVIVLAIVVAVDIAIQHFKYHCEHFRGLFISRFSIYTRLAKTKMRF